MQTAARAYMAKTESAVRDLLSGVASYRRLLRPIRDAVFVCGETDAEARRSQFEKWYSSNRSAIAAARDAQRRFSEESFAMAVLSGGVLQVAHKALEQFSVCDFLPISTGLPLGKGHARFCVGREVRGVQLGLVVYAARNQHAHYEDDELREPSRAVFRQLATGYACSSNERIPDPAFDLENPLLESYAHNVISLIGWRSYNDYERDLCEMLRIYRPASNSCAL